MAILNSDAFKKMFTFKQLLRTWIEIRNALKAVEVRDCLDYIEYQIEHEKVFGSSGMNTFVNMNRLRQAVMRMPRLADLIESLQYLRSTISLFTGLFPPPLVQGLMNLQAHITHVGMV